MNNNKTYLSALAYVLVFNLIIITTTLVLHEAGHFATGSLLNCQNMEIVLLDSSFNTYTEMNCPVTLSSLESGILNLSGFLFVIPFTILLMFFDNYEKFYSFVAIGFNLLISSSDMAFLPQFAFYISALLGIFIIIYGEILLIDRYVLFIDSNKKLY